MVAAAIVVEENKVAALMVDYDCSLDIMIRTMIYYCSALVYYDGLDSGHWSLCWLRKIAS